jgi:dihydroxyacid dehydratase/phosphogluconate dehydratase
MSRKLNKYSSRITQPPSQGASQAMLHATGLTRADMDKPEVGISAVWYEGNSCNMHLNDLAAIVKRGVVDAGLVGMRFNTIGVSDGISMGTDGMSYSLQSRDLIADSIETVMAAQWYDANISIPGCDKNMPGCMIAIGRLNRPALMIRWREAGYRVCVSVVWRAPREIDRREQATRHHRARMPRRWCLRRDVHREHDGIRNRSDGDVPAL